MIRRAVPRRRHLGRLFVRTYRSPVARELVVRGAQRAAEQTKMSNGQVPPLPGSVATPNLAPGSFPHCPGGSRAMDNKSAIASTASPPEPDEQSVLEAAGERLDPLGCQAVRGRFRALLGYLGAQGRHICCNRGARARSYPVPAVRAWSGSPCASVHAPHVPGALPRNVRGLRSLIGPSNKLFTHVHSLPGFGIRRGWWGVEGASTSRPWMGWWFPPPRRSPPRSPGSPFTRHLALDLVGAAPGAPGR